MTLPSNIRTYLSIALILLAALIIFLDEPGFSWIEVQFALFIWVATFLTRSASTRIGIFHWAVGAGFSVLLLLLLGNIFKWTGVNPETVFMKAVILPLFEEILKILPVILAVFFLYKKRKLTLNPSTLLFLGVMSAVGFSMVEKSYWENISFPFTYGPHIGNYHFFSDALGIWVRSKPMGFIGHGAATGLIAMGIGLGISLKKTRTFCSIWWIFPIFTSAWILAEHMLLNLYYANGSTALLLLGGGMLTPWIFLLFLAAVLWTDMKNTIRAYRLSPKLKDRFFRLFRYFKSRRSKIR
ncbi:PrsW family glutamic-type intramembrane protease, partial [Acidobacteriota bacterium]